MVAWALATSHPQRLKSLTVLSTPHPIALQDSRKADATQDRRLDYIRFFRLRDGSPEAALLADGARRLRAAFDPRVPKDLVDEAARRLAEPGALSTTLNWYRAVDGALHVPAGDSRPDPPHLGRERHGTRRGRRHENEGFRQRTLP